MPGSTSPSRAPIRFMIGCFAKLCATASENVGLSDFTSNLFRRRDLLFDQRTKHADFDHSVPGILFLLADTADSADAFVDHRRIAGIGNAADTGNRDVQLLARVNVDVGGTRNSNLGALRMQIIC